MTTLTNRIVTVLKRNTKGLTVSELTNRLDQQTARHGGNFVPLSSIRARLSELSSNGTVAMAGVRPSAFDKKTPSTVYHFTPAL